MLRTEDDGPEKSLNHGLVWVESDPKGMAEEEQSQQADWFIAGEV